MRVPTGQRSSSPPVRPCICCRWWKLSRASTEQGFRAGIAACPLRVLRGGGAGRRRQGLHAIRGLAQKASSGSADLRRAEQRHHPAFHRLEARAGAGHSDDAGGLSRQRAYHQRPARQPSAVRHRPRVHRRCDAAAPGRRHPDTGGEQRGAFAIPASCADLKGERRRRSGRRRRYGMWLPAGSSPEFAKQVQHGRDRRLARQARCTGEVVGDRIDFGGLDAGRSRLQEIAADIALWQPIVKATGYKIN